MIQLQNQNSGFVLDFAQAYPASTAQDKQQIMQRLSALPKGSRSPSNLYWCVNCESERPSGRCFCPMCRESSSL